jgi:AraC-like DNA-binding protein
VKRRSLRRKLRAQNWDALAADLDYQAYMLCERWNVNRKALIRAFREEFDIPPQAFFERIRDRHARALLGKGMRKKEIVDELGYKHASHLSRRLHSSPEPPP